MTRRVIAGLVVVITVCGCPRQAPPPPAQIFAFTATNETVAATNIPRVAETEYVAADFNLDGLPDLAVIETNAASNPRVTIYVRRPVPSPSEMSQMASYYRGGEISLEADADIIGLMTRGSERYSDLIVLVKRDREPNEMIHFFNDGVRFTRAPDPRGSRPR